MLRPLPAGWKYRFDVSTDFWTLEGYLHYLTETEPRGGDGVLAIYTRAQPYCYWAQWSCPTENPSNPDDTKIVYCAVHNDCGCCPNTPHHIVESISMETEQWLGAPSIQYLSAGLDTYQCNQWWTNDPTKATWGDITVNATLIPKQPLALYLSRDCDNPLNADSSDDCDDTTPDWDWVPRGRDPSGDGTVWLVASWSDAATRPSSASFALSNISSYSGHAMNYPPEGASMSEINTPDVSFAMPSSAAFDSRGIAKVKLTITDWAAYATASVVAGSQDRTLNFPVDVLPVRPDGTTGNRIADAPYAVEKDQGVSIKHSEYAQPELAVEACDDTDATPAGNGTPGDGLVAWAEYRGYVLNGKHHRFDPTYKDAFVAERNQPTDWSFTNAFQYFATTGLYLHHPRASEMGTFDEADTQAEFCPGTTSLVQGPSVYVAEYVHSLVQDDGWTNAPISCVPLTLSCQDVHTYINTRTIRIQSPPNSNDGFADLPSDEFAAMKVIAHEGGHRVAIGHYCYLCSNPGSSLAGCTTPGVVCTPSARHDCTGLPSGSCGPASVMASSVWWALPDTFPPGWQNIPTTLVDYDLQQMQVCTH